MTLSEQHQQALNELAKSQQRSVDSLIDEAIGDYLERQTEQEFLQRSLDGETAYLTSGLHVTLEELSDWQEQRTTDSKAPYPQCHK